MKKVLIIFLCLIASTVFADHVDYKIGPRLHKELSPSRQTMSYGLIKVIVVMEADHLSELPSETIAELARLVESLGGNLGNNAFNNVHVWIPEEKIKELAEWDKIKLIKLPTKPGATGVISEGVSSGNITNWHSGGLTGAGVKVGVLDGGFKGYETLLGSELPVDTTAVYTGSMTNFNSDVHGTACAEIVYDAAPGSKQFLVNVADISVDYATAVYWLKRQNVDIITSSYGLNLLTFSTAIYYLLSSYALDQYYAAIFLEDIANTDDQINQLVEQTVSSGITWVQSAGNSAQSRWKGFYNDPDGDKWHNFNGSDQLNEIAFLDGSHSSDFYITLGWASSNNFTSTDDYDLYILNQYGYTVARSVQNQLLTRTGLESCKITPLQGIKYYIGIKRYSGKPQEITLLIGHENIANLQYNSPSKTVNSGTPNGNASVISVGTVPYYNPSEIESFSSQGPNEDGIIKPDIVAPDGVSTVSYDGPFYGTSAAAPYVAGICALVKQRHPLWTPLNIKNYLKSNAKDLGKKGADNVYGSGLAQVPEIKLTTYYRDNDGDGYGDRTRTKEASSQPSGYVIDNTDCNDWNDSIHPGEPEIDDGKDNNCDGVVDNIVPDRVLLTSPSGQPEDVTPTFVWNKDVYATWYKLLIWDSSEQEVYTRWYDASNICSGGNCSVTLESELPSDNYEWWVKSWNDYGKAWSDGMSFTVQGDDAPPSKVSHTSPSGQLAASTLTFAWLADPSSTWYRLWIGYPGDQKIFAKWYEASDICSGGNCTVTTGTEFNVGDYEWYVKSWNDYGKVWSDGMNFTVSE